MDNRKKIIWRLIELLERADETALEIILLFVERYLTGRG